MEEGRLANYSSFFDRIVVSCNIFSNTRPPLIIFKTMVMISQHAYIVWWCTNDRLYNAVGSFDREWVNHRKQISVNIVA